MYQALFFFPLEPKKRKKKKTKKTPDLRLLLAQSQVVTKMIKEGELNSSAIVQFVELKKLDM